MDCEGKDTLLIFLLILSGILCAIVAGFLVICCRRKCCGPKKKKAPPRQEDEVEANISTVSQAINYQEAHEERFVGTAVGKEVDSGPQRQEDMAYQTANEESDTDYDSVISYKSRQPSIISFHHEVKTEKLSKMSSSSSSSSISSIASSVSAHRMVTIPPEPVYARPDKLQHVQAPVIRPPSSSSSSSSSSDEDMELTRVIHMEVQTDDYKSTSSLGSDVEDNLDPIIRSPSSSESEDEILAEYTGASESIDQALTALAAEEEEVVQWVDLGADMDWAQKTVDKMEKELQVSERKYSNQPQAFKSSSSSSSSSQSSLVEMTESRDFQDVSPGHGKHLNRFSFDLSSPSLDEEMDEVVTEVHLSVVVKDSPASVRKSSVSSNSSSSSSSSSNSPSKTIAEVDLSIPLSQQIVSELESGDFRYSANYFTHITSDLQGRNSGHIYGIQEEEEEGSSISSFSSVGEPTTKETLRSNKIEDPNSSSYRLKMMKSIVEEASRRSSEGIREEKSSTSSDEDEEVIVTQAAPLRSPLIKQATVITHHSSEETELETDQELMTNDDIATMVQQAIPVVDSSSAASSDMENRPSLKMTRIPDSDSSSESDSSHPVKQMTQVPESSSSSSDSDPDLPINPMTRVATPHKLEVSQEIARSRVLSDISEASEITLRRSSSSSDSSSNSSSDSSVLRRDPRLESVKGEAVRRNSSGISSAPTSIMRMRLSTDYESVYSKVEEAKKKSREESYMKNSKLSLQTSEDSLA